MRDYEQETYYQIEKGKVVSQYTYHNSLKRGSLRRFENAMELALSMLNLEHFPEIEEMNLHASVQILPKSDGTIDSVYIEIRPYKEGMIYPQGHPYVEAVRRCFDVVPDWDVVTINGQIQATPRWGFGLSRRKEFNARHIAGQKPDFILYDGKDYFLFTLPLQYSMSLYELLKPFLKKDFDIDCYRGYIAQWFIENDELYLQSIRDNQDNSLLSLAFVFPDQPIPVKASWYSGKLQLRPADITDTWEAREKEIVLYVENGIIINNQTDSCK